jgi:predicted deacylase
VYSKTIRGSLRETALKLGKKILLFEGGEPRRFSPAAVNAGVAGALRALAAVGIVEPHDSLPITSPTEVPAQSRSTTWVRASRGGIFRLGVTLGDRVARGELLGIIGDPSDRGGTEVRARVTGMVMGHAVNPLVHRGDGIVHIAELE